MRRRRGLAAMLSLVVGLVVSACGAQAPRQLAATLSKAPAGHTGVPSQPKPASGHLTPFSVALDWTGTEPQEMGVWIALDKGWYRAAGLNVHVEPYSGSSLAVQVLAGGSVNAAVATASTVVLAKAKHVPVKMVAVFTQKDPNSFRYFVDSGIKGPKDFVGKKLGIVPGSVQALLWPQYARAAGINRRDVTVINLTTKNFVQELASHRVDIANGSFGSTGNLELEQKTHHRIVNALLADYVPLVGYGLVLRDNEMAVPAARAFVQQTVRAWAWMYRHPKVALPYGAAQIRRHVTDAPSAAILEKAASQMLQLVRSPATKGHPFGWAPSNLWQRMVDVLGVGHAVHVSDVFTTSLLSARG